LDLENIKKEFIEEVKEAQEVNKNKSFEIIDFSQPNIRNVLLSTK